MPTQQEINLTAYKSGKTPEEIQRLLQEKGLLPTPVSTTTPNVGQQTTPTIVPPPSSPAPGSVSSILGEGFGAEDSFITQYTQDQLNQYNQPIDETAIRKQKETELQAQIDAINAVYADRLRQEKTKGQGRLGSGRALQARSGLIGSDFGAAQTENISQLNREQEQSVENERLALVSQVLSGAQKSAADEIAAKRAAKEAGGREYLNYLANAQTRKTQRTQDAARKLLALGKSPQDISDEELRQAGINKNELAAEFNTLDQARAEAEYKQRLDYGKTEAEIKKLNADIAKGQLDASKYYEVGNRIYEQGTNRYVGDAAFNPYSNTMQVTPGNMVYDAVTRTFTQAPIPGSTTGDLRQYASQYPNEASLKNNNPAGITFSQGFADRLTQAGIQFQKGTNRPANEGGSYFGFPTIEEGMKAYDLLWSSPSYTGLTLNQALNRWNTGSTEKGYGTQISGEVGINGNTRVSDLSPDQLRAVQMAQLKRESPGMYKVLNSGGGTGTGGYDENYTSEYTAYNNDGKVTETMKKGLAARGKSLEQFQKEAVAYKREKLGKDSEQYLNSIDALMNADISRKERLAIDKGGGIMGLISGDYADIQNAFNNIISKLNITSLTNAKAQGATFGQLSNQELKVLGDAATSLKLTSSDAEWKRQLALIANKLLEVSGLPPKYDSSGNLISGGATPSTAGTQTGNTLQSTTGTTPPTGGVINGAI